MVPPLGTGPDAKKVATTTPRFSLQDPDDLTIPPLEDACLPRAMILLDLSTLESLEMTISHITVMDNVHYGLQAQSFSRLSLPSTSSKGQWEPSPKVKEHWAIIMLHYIMETSAVSIDLSKYSLS